MTLHTHICKQIYMTYSVLYVMYIHTAQIQTFQRGLLTSISTDCSHIVILQIDDLVSVFNDGTAGIN